MNHSNRIASFSGPFLPPLAARTAPADELLSRRSADRTSVVTGVGRWLGALRQGFEHRRERARTQRALADLDDRLLRDIGLSRADVGVQLEPPFLGLGEALMRDPEQRRGGLAHARSGLWHL